MLAKDTHSLPWLTQCTRGRLLENKSPVLCTSENVDKDSFSCDGNSIVGDDNDDDDDDDDDGAVAAIFRARV